MPALLKGWIDRVFSNGWAFDYSVDGRLEKRLRHLRVHLIGLAGADGGTFERHGYSRAMQTQIDPGIFDYCGAQVLSSTVLTDSESADPQLHLASARALGRGVFPCAGAAQAVSLRASASQETTP